MVLEHDVVFGSVNANRRHLHSRCRYMGPCRSRLARAANNSARALSAMGGSADPSAQGCEGVHRSLTL
jgi:hypothetical protein